LLIALDAALRLSVLHPGRQKRRQKRSSSSFSRQPRQSMQRPPCLVAISLKPAMTSKRKHLPMVKTARALIYAKRQAQYTFPHQRTVINDAK